LQPRTTLIDSALGAMGPGLPAGIAAKLAFPDRRIVVVVGDGGFMMNSQELETAVRLGISLTVLIFNDAGLGIVRLKQAAMGYGTFAVDFDNPDFVAYAEAFGAIGHRPKSGDDYRRILASPASSGVHVVDLEIDYSQNAELMMEMAGVDCAPILG
jgi:acetolactate synthase-1/2/3 large subunit